MVINMLIRKKLSYKYYIKWKPKYNIYSKSEEDITNDFLIKMYTEYITKLNKFIKELDRIKGYIRKINFKPNYRQIDGCERCVINYPDKYSKPKKLYEIKIEKKALDNNELN